MQSAKRRRDKEQHLYFYLQAKKLFSPHYCVWAATAKWAVIEGAPTAPTHKHTSTLTNISSLAGRNTVVVVGATNPSATRQPVTVAAIRATNHFAAAADGTVGTMQHALALPPFLPHSRSPFLSLSVLSSLLGSRKG